MVLRRHRDDDAERVLEACSDERTAYWLGHFPSPYTRRHAEDLLAHVEDDDPLDAAPDAAQDAA